MYWFFMNPKPTWTIILAGLVLIYLGYSMGGFFVINYFIGGLGILFGLYNLYQKKK